MSIRILVVDDTRFLRKMLTDILSKAGFEVVGEAENGEISIQKFKELRPDIVMMDITMPEMDGITALKEIKLIDPDAIIIICSAMSQRDLISQALKAGANGYVMKPFRPDAVKEIIEEVLPIIESRRQPPEETVVSLSDTVEITEEEKSMIMAPAASLEMDETSEEVDGSLETEDSEEVQVEDDFLEVRPFGSTREWLEEEQAVKVPSDPEQSDHLVIEGQAQEFGNPFVFSAFQPRTTSSTLANDTEKESVWEIETRPVMQFEEFSNREDSSEQEMEDSSEQEMEDSAEIQTEEEFESEMIGGTTEMENYDEQVAATTELNHDAVDFENGLSSKRKRKNIKNLMTSYLCHWVEEMNDQDVGFHVIYSESDQSIQVEMVQKDNEKQTIRFSLEGFSYLVEWLEEKGVDLGRHQE